MTRPWAYFIAAVLIFLFPVCFLYAEPALKTEISNPIILESQTTLFTIKIEWPKEDGTYHFAVPDLHLKNLRLERVGESQESFQQNQILWARKSFEFELKADKAGEGIIQEFRITYIDTAKGLPSSVLVPEQKIRVNPNIAKSKKWFTLIPIGVITVLGFIFFLFFQSKQKSQAKSKPISDLERQIKDIETFAEQNDAQLSRTVLFELAHKFRDFLMNYYKIPPTRATDAELFQEILKQDLSGEERDFLRKLSDHLAQMKYAQAEVPVSDLRGIKYQILQFVRSKRIHEVEPAT